MKYHVWTEGCQMNVADSRRTAAALERLGYTHTRKPEGADVIILNTCVVRQSAEDKAIGRLQSIRPLKRKNPALVINLMGCLVGIKRGENKLRERFPFVDVFSPPSDFSPLINFLTQRDGQLLEKNITQERYSVMDGDLVLPAYEHDRLVSAYISTVLGCSHACTYCIIPSKRGAERSRHPGEIIAEANSLVSHGVREITLLGQIIDRYGIDQPGYPSLAGLLHTLHDIDGLERIRFLTSHPNWMTDELLDTVSKLPKVMPHIEVPAQSGDDEILTNMRRGYSASQYRQLITRIREHITGVSIATDIIVGFPGETEAQFQNSYDLLADLKMDVAHLARYSPRPGTVSATRLIDDVLDEEKWRRFRLLEDLQKGIATEIHSRLLGQSIPVLFEELQKGRWRGRTPTNKLVFVETEEDLRGQILPVEITWTGPWSMQAKLIEQLIPAPPAE
jgi:tRNA-2-methylthio-N6-dimethylallyladenosine synthase